MYNVTEIEAFVWGPVSYSFVLLLTDINLWKRYSPPKSLPYQIIVINIQGNSNAISSCDQEDYEMPVGLHGSGSDTNR